MSDVKESKELLQSLIDAVDVMEKVLEDHQVSLLDLRYVPELIKDLKPGLDGISKVKDEMAGADAEALKEVSALGIELALKLLDKLS